MNRNAQTGEIIRGLAVTIIAISSPFLIYTPSNIYAGVSFAFGNFLLFIGGIIQ